MKIVIKKKMVKVNDLIMLEDSPTVAFLCDFAARFVVNDATGEYLSNDAAKKAIGELDIDEEFPQLLKQISEALQQLRNEAVSPKASEP